MPDAQENNENQKTIIITQLILNIIKFIAGGILMSSMLYLVIKDKLSPDIYVNFASMALTAMGMHEISKKK